MENKGFLILGKQTKLIDVECREKYTMVSIAPIQEGDALKTKAAPYDAISWVSTDWFKQ